MNNLSSLEEISQFRAKHYSAELIIDTNILLLLLVGAYDKEFLTNCGLMTENGKNYKIEDYNVLIKIVARFLNKITITPQITAEIWSLSKTKIPSVIFNKYFSQTLESLKSYQEKNIPLSVILQNHQQVLEFGFTDIGLTEAARENKAIILTDEYPFYATFREKIPIIKFSNIVAQHLINN
ncbi:MAG: hypothetical protein PHD49_00170 [Candidatus Shapirobacteria bacterium]|nr:hypothetical protein [Candidatus Shapirobacteria bacterium]